MDYPNLEKQEQRGDYINNWYQSEKSAERMGGVILLFAAALIAVLDQPGDQWTLYTIVGCISGAITLLIISRKPRAARTALHFLRGQPQTSRAMYAGMGAMILITQLGARPLALIVGGLLLIMAGWFQWRAHKIKRFDELFNPHGTQSDSEGETSA